MLHSLRSCVMSDIMIDFITVQMKYIQPILSTPVIHSGEKNNLIMSHCQENVVDSVDVSDQLF